MKGFKSWLLASILLFVSLSSATSAQQKLVLAADNSPPYSFVDEHGEMQGLSVELARALASNLEASVSIVECPWARCLSLVEEGQADLLIGLSKDPYRQQQFHFIHPPFFTGTRHFGFFVCDPSLRISRFEDLQSLVIGQLRGSNHFPRFDQDKTIEKVSAVDMPTLVDMLESGRIDAFIHLQSTAAPMLQALNKVGSVHQSPYVETFSVQGFAVLSLRSPWLGRAEEIDTAMKALITDGQIAELFAKYQIDTSS